MTSPSTKRLLKESTDLHKNPSPYFAAAPVTDTNLHDWHFTLAGPPAPTPYAGGLYHGRITFPPSYPLRPPSFRFLTPSGRFEVNREICLSISGHHEETWQPAWGVRTALLAIRSEIMGCESQGQVGGMEGSVQMRREYARLSRGWTCRECGVSNEGVMRGVWGVCRELGVEAGDDVDVDVGGDDGAVDGEKGMGMGMGEEENGNGDVEGEEGKDDGVQSPSVQDVSSGTATETASASAARPARPASTTPVNPLPRPTPTTTATPASANTPWLDRAIVVVVMALILLILRRVSGVDEL